MLLNGHKNVVDHMRGGQHITNVAREKAKVKEQQSASKSNFYFLRFSLYLKLNFELIKKKKNS